MPWYHGRIIWPPPMPYALVALSLKKILPMWLVVLALFILPLSFQAQIIEVSDFFLGNLVTFRKV